jgi:hypothetical protein
LVINLKDLGYPLPNSIINILTSESWIKMGVGISHDLKYLSESYNLPQCNGGVELYNMAVLANFERPNLLNLYRYFFGEEFDEKRDTQSDPHNWLKPLTEEQFSYVVGDTLMSYKIGMAVLEPAIRVLQSKKIEIVKHNFKTDRQINHDYVTRLQQYAQSRRYSLPNYIITVVPNSHPAKVKAVCEWKEMTEKVFECEDSNKKTVKQEVARQMLLYINSL